MKFPRKQFEAFCSRLILNSKEKGRVPFKWNGAQVRFIDEMEKGLVKDQHKIVVCKARQLGITTMTLALDLFWLFRHPGTQGALAVSNESVRDLSRNILTNYIEGLPNGMKVPVKVDNRTEIRFANTSRLAHMIAGGRNSGALARGQGLNYCHMTEMSSWADPEGVVSLDASLAETHPHRLYVAESPLALDTPVPTPHGWSTIGSLKHGDRVYDDEGNETEVVGLSPVFLDRRCFAIEFNTGETVVADAAHKWRVERMGSSVSRWHSMVVTTAQLDVQRDRIWMGAPLEGRECPLPINPYFLGVWLGDGHNEAVRITVGDEDMAATRANLQERDVRCGPVTKFKGRGGGVFGIHGMMGVFREQNLIHNKHIPEAYLRAPVEDRLELLRGLMDTDGTINKGTSTCAFTNNCRPLVNDFCELLATFGIRYHVQWVDAQDKVFSNGQIYACRSFAIVHFSAPKDNDIFALARKRDRQRKANTAKRRDRRSSRARILSIREVLSVPVRCIEVDTPSHLFRVGRTMLTTHNTARGFNVFHDMWEDAERSLSTNAIFIGWWAKEDYAMPRTSRLWDTYGRAHPSRDEQAWAREVKKRYGHTITAEQFAWWRWKWAESGESRLLVAEYPWTADQAFVMTGDQFFGAQTLKKMKDAAVTKDRQCWRYIIGPRFEDTRLEQDDDGPLSIFEEPQAGVDYVIAADPAYGESEWSDSFCAQVLRCERDHVVQVAEFNTPDCTMYGFAWILAHLAGAYSSLAKPVTLILELNGPGRGVLQELQRMPEQYADRIDSLSPSAQRALQNLFGSIRHYLYRRPDSLSGGRLMQWETTWKTKQIMMNLLRDCIERGMVEINSPEWPEEARYVTQNGSKIEAEGHHKDDRVVAMAMGIIAWQQQVLPDLLTAHAEAGYGRGPATPLDRAVHNWLDGVRSGAEDALWTDAPSYGGYD